MYSNHYGKGYIQPLKVILGVQFNIRAMCNTNIVLPK